MALILDSLYDALKAAGASEEQARAAARDVAGYDTRSNKIERDTALLKWMLGVAIAVLLGLFWMQWQGLDRLAALDARVMSIETGLARLDGGLGQLTGRLAAIEDHLARIEGSPGDPGSR